MYYKKDFRKHKALDRALNHSNRRRQLCYPLSRQHKLQKGGVPATPSGTATLLRLSPNYPGFHGLTGGVYKARERIHRAMADARLLANPASWSRVADSNPN